MDLMNLEPTRVLCLVGSTQRQWKSRYRQVEEGLTKAGYAVFTVVWFRGQLENFESHRDLLERVHCQKIRSSDAVVLIDKNALGKHTALELDFALMIGKPVVICHSIEATLDELRELL